MPAIIVPGAIKRNVYLFSDDHTEKRDTHLPDVEWVNDEIEAEETRAKAAEATLQANIDAEETRAKAAEATKENLSNKVTSTATYVSDDTHYATTKTVDQRIAEVSPPEVKWATYDDTDFWTIEEWMDDGLLVLCNYSDHIYEATWKDGSTINFASLLSDQTFADAYHLTCSSRWGWEDGVTNLEVMNNKQTSDTSWFSNDALYPTTSAVDARIAAISPKEIEWATYGTTTSAQLETWLTAGKTVLLKYNNNSQIMRLDYRTSSTSHSFHSIWTSGSANLPRVYEVHCDNNTWSNGSISLQVTSNMRKSTDGWASVDSQYPSCKAVENYVASNGGVEWATYGTTTYSQIKSWNDAGKAVFLKYTVSGPVDYILKLTIVTPGGAFFCGVQGVSEYTAEVNPANQWQYHNPGLQAAALIHEYETWDETDDTSYPSLASVSNYVASHSGGGLHVFTRGGTEALAEVLDAFNAGEVCVCYDEDQDVYMQLISISDYQASFAAVDSSRWLYNTNAWDGEWDDCWTNRLLSDASIYKSTDTWTSTDSYVPSLKAVENYVAAHTKDVYDIAIPGIIQVTCDTCFYDDVNAKWSVKFNGSGTMYGPRINFKLLKNGNELQFDSNVKLVAEPYVSSGTKTYSSGQYFNAPSAPGWGTMSQDSSPATGSGKYFGIRILQSSASTSPDNSSIYIKYPGGGSYTANNGLDPVKCYFTLSLYDKNVSTTVPVAHKVIQIVPTLMANGSLELQSNKLLSTSTWTSDNTKYPTSQAIANYVAANAGPIKIASSSNTANEIYTWQQAGNAVFLKSGTDLYALQYCSPSNAYFVQLYVPDANTDPRVYWKVVSGSTWTSGDFYLQKKSAAADVYEIEGDGTIFFPVSAMKWDNNNMKWQLTHYPATGTGDIYTPRTNFRMLKNGSPFAFSANHWLNITPYTASGQTWASGSNIVAPTSTWGDKSVTVASDGNKIGACFNFSYGGSVSSHTSYLTMYGRISPNTTVSSWDETQNFFWVELYDKTVSETVPVCRKLMRFAPTVIGNFDMSGQTFAWITALKANCADKMYMKAVNSQWYDGTVLRYTNTNAAGNCHYFVGLAYNSSDGGTYTIRYSKQVSSASYDAKKITLTS